MQREWLIFAVAAGILVAFPVHAEEKWPRVEIGGTVSGRFPMAGGDGPVIVLGAGPRITLNLTRSLALETFGEIVGPVEGSGTLALYEAQLKYVMRRSDDGRSSLSLTAGVAGGAWYRHAPERRIVRLDGSTVVYPGYRQVRATAPNTVGVGIAHERVLGRIALSRFELAAYVGSFAALRASAGLSFGIGGYR